MCFSPHPPSPFSSNTCHHRHARDASSFPPSPTESIPSTLKSAERAPPLITLAPPPLVTLTHATPRVSASVNGGGGPTDDAAALAASWLSQTWRMDGANALCIAPILRLEAGGCEQCLSCYHMSFMRDVGTSTAVLLSPTPMVAMKQQSIPAGVRAISCV